MHLSRSLLYVVCAVGLVTVLVGAFWWLQTGDNAGERPVYVGLGASDAVGIGAQRPGRDGWVARVHGGLPDDSRLVNLGINGARMSDVLALQVPVAVDAEPAWVTLWPGVNDLRDDVPLAAFREQLNETLEELGEVDAATVVLLTIPDLRHLPEFEKEDPQDLDATVREWNDVIVEIAGEHGAVVVDLYAGAPELAENPEYVSADGFHPSSAGYRRIGEMVLDTLEERHALVSGE